MVEPSLESSDGTRHSSGTNTILKKGPMHFKKIIVFAIEKSNFPKLDTKVEDEGWGPVRVPLEFR